MWHAAHSQPSTHSAHLSVTPTANQSLAKHNRKPSQLAENKHQRAQSIASFCRLLASPPRLTNHDSRIASFLFDTNKTPKISILVGTLMKTNEKRFSIRYKFASRCFGLPAAECNVAQLPRLKTSLTSRDRNAACLGFVVVLTCPAAWGQIGLLAWTEASTTATGA
jgi:hypothetical protein